MKTIKPLFTIIILTGILLASCKSTPTTFVNTGTDIKGEVYTVYVFSKLTEVSAVNKETNETFKIPVKSCKYDSVTTKLEIPLDESIPYSAEQLTFHIEGKMTTPNEFVLTDFDKSRGYYIVFFEGKQVFMGTDYNFDKETSCISFTTDSFIPNMSYNILWITNKDGMNSISNDYEKFKEQYESMTMNWIYTLN